MTTSDEFILILKRYKYVSIKSSTKWNTWRQIFKIEDNTATIIFEDPGSMTRGNIGWQTDYKCLINYVDGNIRIIVKGITKEECFLEML